jgi:SsrA-binding protein
MSSPSPKSGKKSEGEKLIASNPIAYSNYAISEIVEAGMVLAGTEAKSLRSSAPNLRDAFVEVRGRGERKEAWLLNCHIGPYSHGNIWNHEALRPRKLLLHGYQIDRMYDATTQKGLQVIPIRMYFKSGRAKIELGFGKGKKKYDKREDLKKRDAQRDMEVARTERSKGRKDYD